jgi:hypothetical protein
MKYGVVMRSDCDVEYYPDATATNSHLGGRRLAEDEIHATGLTE